MDIEQPVVELTHPMEMDWLILSSNNLHKILWSNNLHIVPVEQQVQQENVDKISRRSTIMKKHQFLVIMLSTSRI